MAQDASLPPEPAQSTNVATIQSIAPEASESSSIQNIGTSGINSDDNREKALQFAHELTVKGNKALKENDYAEATECFSRALEIRTLHFGELAPECINAYYEYGSALLYKAQEDADPVGLIPKKDAGSQQDSDKDGSAKSNVNGESSVASVSSCKADPEASSIAQREATNDVGPEKLEEADGDDDEESDAEDPREVDEDESDLDLAWKMLDLARAIAEKHSRDSMEMVDILSSLAEVAMEREDFETSLSDYLKALNLLERLVEPDSRRIAELNFRICLCLEISSKAQEAIPYCQSAISILKSRVQRLIDEVKNLIGAPPASSASDAIQERKQLSDISATGDAVSSKQAEIECLSGLFGDMEKKLEDLQHQVSNPSSMLSDLLEAAAAKARGSEQTASTTVVGGSAPAVAATGGSSSRVGILNGNGIGSGGFDSPTVSTGHTNATPAVTHLGTVGRGVKRVVTTSGSTDSNPAKKPAFDAAAEQDDSNAS